MSEQPPTRIESYTQEPSVNWLGVGQLIQTGVRALLATTIGRFADARELAAALQAPDATPHLAHDTDAPCWLDYLADTGDGWDATYSVAYTVAQPQLAVEGLDVTLPRGQMLVLGGDQVYPTPAGGAYRTRFLDPFRAAAPADIPPRDAPTDPLICALPGNHDWYDGLRGFTQIFCRGQGIGRYRTEQRTSYFAKRLAHGWWVWGIDLQLDSEIDTPQLAYFDRVLREAVASGERIILCAPEPSWIDESERLETERALIEEGGRARWRGLRGLETQAARFRSLREIEARIAQSGKARCALVIAGDSHHYAHYTPDTPGAPVRITCGGGGAYLLGTHALPESLAFQVGARPQRYRKACTYPDAPTSRRLRNAAWKLPATNPGFGAVLAGIYLVYLWVLQSASKWPHPGLGGKSLMEYLAALPDAGDVGHALGAIVQVLAHSPASVLFSLAVVGGAAAFSGAAARTRPALGRMGGALHGLLHLALTLGVLWGMARVNLGVIAPLLGHTAASFVDHPLQVGLFLIEAGALGALGGALLVGLWLVATNAAFGWHGEEVFSSQRIADYKSFLRLAIRPEGVTVYPLKIERVCRRWRLGAGVTALIRAARSWRLRVTRGAGPRFEPVTPISVALIEAPIFISGADHESF